MKRRRCLHCRRPVYLRGVCQRHYGYLQQAVWNGWESWKHAERCGQCLPSKLEKKT